MDGPTSIVIMMFKNNILLAEPKWNKKSWRNFVAHQQPEWFDADLVKKVVQNISSLPPLILSHEAIRLQNLIASAQRGESFILQAGECSEDFSACTEPTVRDSVVLILQMAAILSQGLQKKIISIGRISGQYAKPRTDEFEVSNNQQLPVYRGDMVNSHQPFLRARIANPKRMLGGYFRSAASLNYIRAFLGSSEELNEYLSSRVLDYKTSVAPLGSHGLCDLFNQLEMMLSKKSFEKFDRSFFTSHEALLLDYEEAMTRELSESGLYYNAGAHFLWLGDRTRLLHSAHIEYLRGIINPLGIKIGPDYNAEELIEIIKQLNPNNIDGKISLITRFGVTHIETLLPQLLNMLDKQGLKVAWLCDPMHGNTYRTDEQFKTRDFKDIINEMALFCRILNSKNAIVAGVHLELTGERVTECVGGIEGLTSADLKSNYCSSCDPRLNITQAIEFAFELLEMIKQN